MIPWVHLDTTSVPGGSEFKLMQRGDEFWIMVGTNPLMTSRMSGSEEVLAEVTCTPLAGKPGAKILIGGLGMGFTLRKAQALLRPDARIVVAELVPGIVTWARGPLVPVFKGCLDDERVEVIQDDVGKVIGGAKGAYDAILLDVDNGPEGLSRPGNDRLYSAKGLAAAKAALKPGGVLAVWSAHPDEAFAKRLKQAGFAVEEVKARAHGKRGGSRHLIWLGRKG
jgi:spermidine synthase